MEEAVFELVECVFIPDVLEEGKLYYSRDYQTIIHLCACGCGHKSVTPVGGHPVDWSVQEFETHPVKISLSPSILNRWCESHYFIKQNKIEWCK